MTSVEQISKLPIQASIRFLGEVHAGEDISAIALIGDRFVIGADEPTERGQRNLLQMLDRESADVLRIDEPGDFVLSDGGELDIEDIAFDGHYFLYVIGSHSARRKRIDAARSQRGNRRRLAKIEKQSSRDAVFRVRLDDAGKPVEAKQISLRKTLQKQKLLKPFAKIPSKENGIDIEALAVRDGWLYAGFRGPVLRDNYVPVMRFRFRRKKHDARLLFVELGGLGIRAMTETRDGFLLIGGPVGDGPGEYRVFFWNGEDCLPGADQPAAGDGLILLGQLELPHQGAKAEGIAVLAETESAWETAVVFDNARVEGTFCYSLPK